MVWWILVYDDIDGKRKWEQVQAATLASACMKFIEAHKGLPGGNIKSGMEIISPIPPRDKAIKVIKK